MRLFRIRGEDQDWLANLPETSMGLQVTAGSEASYDELVLAIGGQVAVYYRELLRHDGEVSAIEILSETWLSRDDHALETTREEQFADWLERLKPFEMPLQNSRIVPSIEFKLFPIGPFPQPPPPSQWTYGHLPFVGLTGADEVYYRWEPWPTSKRIHQITGKVVPGTFTAPMSELPFMPTGFSAVARLALPGLLPACFRWELQPPARTPTRCGAGVPMYGQSGGGVEVAFNDGFNNIGPIANPVVLPPL